jgi:hypothetical protein
MQARLNASGTPALLLTLVALAASPAAAAGLDPLTVRLSTDKASYVRGDQATFTLEVTNNAAYPVTVSFATGQQYDFVVRDSNGTAVWTWSDGRSFGSSTVIVLGAGQTYQAQERWAFTSYSGAMVADGNYTLTGLFLGDYVGRSGAKYAEQLINLSTPDFLQVSVHSDKSRYNRGETALLTLSVTNTASFAMTVQFSTAQLYDFTAVSASGTRVWAWSTGKTFNSTPVQLTLAAGETRLFQETWSFVSDAGLGVPDGSYTLNGYFLGDYVGRIGLKGGSTGIELYTPDPLRVSFSPISGSYQRFSPAQLTLTVTNVASYAVTISFPTTQRYDFSAKNPSGATVWTWSRGRTFDPQPTHVVLAPGQTLSLLESWAFTDDNGLPLPDGTYTVTGSFAGQYYGRVEPKSDSGQIRVYTF